MPADFNQKFTSLQNTKASRLALMIAPRPTQLPLPMQKYDDPFLPFSKAIIHATRDLICVYVFDFAAYLTLGAAGAVALERSIAYGGEDSLTVIHGPFSGAAYAALLDERSFNAHAVTLSDERFTADYARRPDRSAFVVRSGGISTTPGLTVGVYWVDAAVLTVSGNDSPMHLIDADIPYHSHGDDFADRLRDYLEQKRA